MKLLFENWRKHLNERFGAVVYDSRGRIIGILWGIDVERRPAFQVIDNMVWITPIKNINLETSLNTLCLALNNKPKACR